MEQDLDLIACPTCDGFGSISDGSPFHHKGGTPPASITCPNCNGTGHIPKRFFVEFLFDSHLKKYWLPLFIVTGNAQKAEEITASTKKALEEKYTNVEHYKPMPEARVTESYIKHKYQMHKHQKLALLNINVWKFTDLDPNPEWSFDEHLYYIANNEPLEERTVAKRVEAHQFPVREIKNHFPPTDFKEFLLIHVVKG